MNFTILLIGGGALVFFGAANWRWGVFVALLLAVFEGAIRKWLLPQASQMIYFAKDFLLLGAYTGYFLGGRAHRVWGFREGLSVLLLCAAGWTFFESLNPGTGSLPAGFFGWKAYVFYMPLCFIVPALFRSSEQLELCMRYYLVLALPVSLLGVAQFYAPADSPLNVYAPGVEAGSGESPNIAVFGEDQLVRITGTFSYISGYGAYLVIMLAMLLPVLAWSKSSVWQALLSVTMALVIGNTTMTGSRAVALGAALVLAGHIFLSVFAGASAERSRTWVHVLAVGLAVVATVMFFEKAVKALQERAEAGFTGGEGQKRIRAALLEPLDFLGEAGLVGYGNGISQPSVEALRKAFQLPPPNYQYFSPTDTENSRILMELGVPGFLIWYVMRAGLVVTLWQVRNKLTSPFLRQVGLGAFLVLLYQLFTITTFSHTANLYHWFFAGFILLLPKLDKARPQLQPAESIENAPRSARRRAKRNQPRTADITPRSAGR